MITGLVNGDLEAIIPVMVADAGGNLRRVDALIDTGYDGFLMLHPSLAIAFGLTWSHRQVARLADGSAYEAEVYDATVEWDGQRRQIEVDGIGFKPLVGTALLAGYELRLQFIDSGTVRIEAIP